MKTSGETLDRIRARYVYLLHEVSQQVKEDAVREIIGTGIVGIFDMERLQKTALSILKSEDVDTTSSHYAAIASKSDRTGQPIESVCLGVVAEHQETWALIDYVMCHIDAVVTLMVNAYTQANSEAEMLLVPAPEWPDVQSLKEVYRHTPSIP